MHRCGVPCEYVRGQRSVRPEPAFRATTVLGSGDVRRSRSGTPWQATGTTPASVSPSLRSARELVPTMFGVHVLRVTRAPAALGEVEPSEHAHPLARGERVTGGLDDGRSQ